MQIIETPLPGCRLIKPSPIRDNRGYFVRIFDAEAMSAQGMSVVLAQASLSFNHVAGTLRGLHFQAHPLMEDKIVRCAKGSIFDVAIDIRLGSPTFGRWYGATLTDENNEQLYIPVGFAHGFQTLTPSSVVAYHISVRFEAECASGLRYDDPDVGITWPLPPLSLSERDMALPRLVDLDQTRLLPYQKRVL